MKWRPELRSVLLGSALVAVPTMIAVSPGTEPDPVVAPAPAPVFDCATKKNYEDLRGTLSLCLEMVLEPGEVCPPPPALSCPQPICLCGKKTEHGCLYEGRDQ